MHIQQYTEQQQVEIKTEFATRRRRQILTAVPSLAVLVALALQGDSGATLLGLGPDVWPFVAAAVIVGAVAFSLVNWRCPACHKYLGKSINPAFCSKCGVPLRD